MLKTQVASLRKAGTTLLVCLLCVNLLFLPIYPATAQVFGKFGLSDEMELGRKFSIMIKSRLPIIEDPEVKGYITGITNRLLKNIPPQPYQFDVNVLRSDAVNAFASPGGNLFVFTGLILAMDHESEVAGVMAHELAHATQRHIASRIERSQTIGLASMLLALGGMFLGGSNTRGAGVVAPLAAAQTAMLNYSRQDETEADQVGLNYLVAAGYPPQGMYKAFENIRRTQSLTSSGIPTYMSTHPDVSKRVNDMSARIAHLPQNVRDRKDDDSIFLRIKTLVRAKYSNPTSALRFFEQDKTMPGYMNLMGKGILYSRLNRINDAEKVFEEALKVGSGESLVWREAGIFYYTKGGPGSSAKAANYLEKAVKMNPRDYFARFYNALILEETGRASAAELEFREVLRYVPEDSEVHYRYGRLLGTQGKNFEAYLHLAYSSMYMNQKDQAKSSRDKASKYVMTPTQKAELGKFDAKYREREEFW